MELTTLSELAGLLARYRRFDAEASGRLLEFNDVQLRGMMRNLNLLALEATRLEAKMTLSLAAKHGTDQSAGTHASFENNA